MPQHPNIYTLVSKYLAGQADHEERLKLEAWKKTHPEEFETLRKIWLSNSSEKEAFSADRAKHKLNQRIDAFEAEHLQVREHRSYLLLKVAASVCVLLLIAAGVYLLRPWEVMQEIEESWVEKNTARSQMASFFLPDGSKVKLNADSKIRYSSHFGQDKLREIFLEGEAFFEVIPDPQQRFVVHAAKLTTQVLGTSFAVRAYPDDEFTKVTVASGKVEVQLPDEHTRKILLPEKQLVNNKTTGEWSVHSVRLSAELGWAEGKLIFENTSLSEVARILERHYNVKIEFETEALKNCHCTAAFDEKSLFNVLDAIGYINDIAYTFDKGKVTLTGNGCQP